MNITLTTDFGYKDHFVGVMKGVILKIAPHAQIIDICHDIPPQNILKTQCILSSIVEYFSDNTLHVVVVDPGVGSKRRILYVQTEKYQLLVPDNGILSFLPTDNIKTIRDVSNKKLFLQQISSTFHGRDIFAPVAAHLVNGIDSSELGKSVSPREITHFSLPTPKIDGENRRIYGKIIDIDHFGNIITNISEKLLLQLMDDYRSAKIYLGNFCISGITTNYSCCPANNYLALINSELCVEIAKNLGNAAQELNTKIDMDIILEY